MNGTKILLIDPHQLSREGLRLLLVAETYDVVGAARSLDEALAAIEQGLRPDLVLLVLGHSGESQHISALQEIRAGFADFKFVIIATEVSSALLTQCVEGGVSACLLRDMSAEVLTQSLRLVMLGQQIFPTPVAAAQQDRTSHVSRDFGQAVAHAGRSRALSGREGEILSNLLRGHSNKMIARELNISEATVKVHLKALLRKLNARNRTQAAIWAMENGYATNGAAAPRSSAGSAA
jgi:two-component system, NarL family, nitrate/nitrite response regulator NarL